LLGEIQSVALGIIEDTLDIMDSDGLILKIDNKREKITD
jgi:hypothetical protein